MDPLPPDQRSMEAFAAILRRIDLMTYGGPKDFLSDYPARNDDGAVNAVVEIPAG